VTTSTSYIRHGDESTARMNTFAMHLGFLAPARDIARGLSAIRK
jgi:hypothetical protein